MIVITRTGRHRAVTGRAGGIGAVPLRRTHPGRPTVRSVTRVWPLALTLSLLAASTLAGSGLGAWLG